MQIIKVSKVAVNNSYGSGDPHFDISATLNGKRLLKEQIPVGSLVQGKAFNGEEITLFIISFVDDSIKNDVTKAIWRAKAVNMSLPLVTYYQQNRHVEAVEKQAKSAYTDVKGKGYVPSKAGDPVAQAETSAPVGNTDVSDMF